MKRDYSKALSNFLKKEQPRIIMDLGCGWGLIGEEIKEALPEVVLDGLDIDEQSVLKAYKRDILGIPVYRNIINADVVTAKLSEYYDLFVAFNLLDKMKKEDAMKIVNRYKGKLLVHVPIINVPQGKQFGNTFTERISFWNHDEIMEFAEKCIYRGFVFGLYKV